MIRETSGNGWGVYLTEEDAAAHLRWWKIPDSDKTFRLRRGPAGFVLAHTASWFHHRIEPIDPGVDDWGWSPRPNTSAPDEWSNHASATALDLNALKHPYGQIGTFSPEALKRIQGHLLNLAGAIKWGGNYINTKDEMHFEIVVDHAAIVALAVKLRETARGKAVLAVNGLTKVTD